ncbi:B-cell receptor-associated protein 31-like [Trifolium pratense]|nr:B-cell receptor-associated protein 31-like [Trifolium pratense]PNY13701.1 B-cell receptor-associated protein 31-like [Trifolium pratense]
MHHYLQKLINLRGNIGASKEEVENLKKETVELKEKEEKASKEIKQLKKELSNLSEGLKKVKMESEEKDKKVETAEAHVASLQKQAADLLLEYDRLLEDNQNLQAMGHKS